MLAPVIQTLTSRSAALVAWALTLMFAAALGMTWSSAERVRAQLQGRVAALDRQLAHAVAVQKTQAAACGRGTAPTEAIGPVNADPAERLLQAPTGFDVCARMESADQAVLDSLG